MGVPKRGKAVPERKLQRPRGLPAAPWIPYIFCTIQSYWLHCVQGWIFFCWVAWRHPAFIISQILPPKTAKSLRKQGIGGWQNWKQPFSKVFLQKCKIAHKSCPPTFSWRSLLPLWRAMTAHVPNLGAGSERCTTKQVKRLVGTIWNNVIFLKSRGNLRVEMCAS